MFAAVDYRMLSSWDELQQEDVTLYEANINETDVAERPTIAFLDANCLKEFIPARFSLPERD